MSEKYDRLRACDDMFAADRARQETTRWIIAGVIGLTLLGAAVRWRFLDQPMRYDEAYNYLNYSSRSPGYIVTHYVPNNHVLHTLMVSAVRRVLGSSPPALRLPAFLAGVLLIPATAWLGWVLSRRRDVTLLSALGVCVSSALIEYSSNSRGYSLLTLFAVIATVLTLQLMATPSRRRLWVAWGVVGALGAFAVPVMLLIVSGLTVALLIAAFFSRREKEKLFRGLFIGLAVCALLTVGLYSPILLSEGLDKLSGTRQMAEGILATQIPTLGNMLQSTWQLWIRDAAIAGPVVLVVGCAALLLLSMRQLTPERVVPLVAGVVALAIAGILGLPLPARTWLMLLPLLLVSAVAGVCTLSSAADGYRRSFRSGVVTVLLAIVVSFPLFTVLRRPFLCAEPNGLVEVEPALDECHAYGSKRCALIARYTPATAYYLRQKGIDALPPPTSPATERVFIVADGNRSLEQLWHNGVDGFEAYASPQVSRQLSECTLYLAERLPAQASAR